MNENLPPDPLCLYTGCLSGLPYYDYRLLESLPEPGTALLLHREPHNPHDAFALAVYWEHHKLGYIARGPNEVLARMLDAGLPLHAQALPDDGKGGWWYFLVGVGG